MHGLKDRHVTFSIPGLTYIRTSSQISNTKVEEKGEAANEVKGSINFMAAILQAAGME